MTQKQRNLTAIVLAMFAGFLLGTALFILLNPKRAARIIVIREPSLITAYKDVTDAVEAGSRNATEVD